VAAEPLDGLRVGVVVRVGRHAGPVALAPLWAGEGRVVVVYVCRACGVRHTLDGSPSRMVAVGWTWDAAA
jgi:hypothetical protein